MFFYVQVLNWHPIRTVILRRLDMNIHVNKMKKKVCLYQPKAPGAVCSRIRYLVVHSTEGLNEVPLYHPTGGTWHKAMNFSSFIHCTISSVVLFLMFFFFVYLPSLVLAM